MLHGVLKREGEGTVQVQFRHVKGDLHCAVRDNGPGLECALDLATSDKPWGLRITHERILLAQGRRMRGQGLVVRNLQDAQGGVVGTEAGSQLRAIELWDR